MSATAHMITDGLHAQHRNFEFKVIDMQKWNDSRADIAKRMNDARYQLTSQEVEAIEKEIQHVLRWTLVTPYFINAKNVGPGMLTWKYYQWNDVLPPRLSRDPGRRGNVVLATKEESEVKLYAWDYDYYISMTQIDASNNANRTVQFSESLQNGTLTELAESLAEYREWFIHRGTDIPNITDIGITGIFNNANVQDPGALGAGADDDLTAAGDVIYSVTIMATKLILKKFKPPFVLLMTPGVLSQALKNQNSTTFKSDYQYITELKWVQGGVEVNMFETIESDPFLIDDDETNSTGAIGVVKRGDQNMRVIETYPFGFRPLPSQDLGVEGKLMWMGGIELRRTNAVVYADALTIDTI